MQHLRALADAGLNTVHLLPAFDIATIPERRADQADAGLRPRVVPARLARSSRRASTAVAGTDGFNWGYDPCTTRRPEGSYATDPEGPGARSSSARWSPGSTGRACGS